MTAPSDLEQLRARAIQELQREARPVLTGMLALALGVPTHRVQLALQEPWRLRQVNFGAHGWTFVETDRRPAFNDNQAPLDGTGMAK